MDESKLAYDKSVAQLTAAGRDFELVKRAIRGAEYTMYKNAPQTLREVYAGAVEHGDKEFLVYEGERWTFTALFQQAWSLAHGLINQHQISPGDRVGIAMRNYPEWLSVFIAVTSIGGVAVPINSWGKSRDLLFAVSDSECKTVFCDQQRADMMADGMAELNVNVVIARADPSSQSSGLALEEFIADSSDASAPRVDIETEDTAMIMYTSGTTGQPKGAVSTHRALCQAIVNFECTATACAMANPELIGAMIKKGLEPVQMLAVPLFHVSGLHAIFLNALRAGRKIVMMYKWDPRLALELIESERITVLSASPSMLQQLLEFPDFDRYDTSSISSLGGGGSATPAKVVTLMSDKVKDLYAGTGWGMTETNAIGAAFTGKAFVEHPGSAGFCHATVEIKICDSSGIELPKGAAGLLWIKTPTAVTEYWKRPDANKSSFINGWFNSEDIGYFDDKGYLYLSDRAKDLIIRGGENIYPAEIEAVLGEHPAVHEVAAYGIDDERMGELVAVAVVARHDTLLTAEEVQNFASQKLASFKVPAHISILDEPLPRNPAGKVLKHVLKATGP